MAPKYLNAVKSLTLGQAFRMITTAGATLVFAWSFSGPFVQAWAADAFVQMLQENGMDPKDFADIKKQSEKSAEAIDDLADDAGKIKGQIGQVGTSVDRLTTRVDEVSKSSERVERLLNDLIKIQLRRRADMSSSPPGTGPDGIPHLEIAQ